MGYIVTQKNNFCDSTLNQISAVKTNQSEPLVGMQQYNTGDILKSWLCFDDHDFIFKVRTQNIVKFKPKTVCVLTIFWTEGWI